MSPSAARLLTALAVLAVLGPTAGAPEPVVPDMLPHRPGLNQMMVRFVHVAPNAQLDRVVLVDETGRLDLEEFMGIGYLEATDHVPVLASAYDVVVELADAEVPGIDVGTLSSFPGEYLTIALIGLVEPGEADRPAEEGGFLAWLEDLFTVDDEGLALRALVLSDHLTAFMAEHEAEVRVVHAAPGAQAFDLVFVSAAEATALHTVAYGDVSGYASVAPADGVLEVRAAGSDAVVAAIPADEVRVGMIHTVFVTGTPVEEVPLRAFVVSNPWLAAETVPPAAPGAVVPPGALTATEVQWLRDALVDLAMRLETVEARLAALSGVEGAEAEAATALQETEAVSAALAELRVRLEAAVVPEAPLPDTAPP